MTNLIVHEVADLNAADLTEILRESTEEGHRHINRLLREYITGTNRFDQESEALFACRMDHRLIGICGLNRDPYAEANIGRVRRLYVLKEFRGHGVGRRLLEAVIHMASSHYSKLVLKTDNPQAGEFYKHLGFREISNNGLVTHELQF